MEYFVPLNVAEERMVLDLCGAILSEALGRELAREAHD